MVDFPIRKQDFRVRGWSGAFWEPQERKKEKTKCSYKNIWGLKLLYRTPLLLLVGFGGGGVTPPAEIIVTDGRGGVTRFRADFTRFFQFSWTDIHRFSVDPDRSR